MDRETCYLNEIYLSISQTNPWESRTLGSEGKNKGGTVQDLDGETR